MSDSKQSEVDNRIDKVWIRGVGCPACKMPDLFVGNGGYLTCSNVECPNPDYAESLGQVLKQEELKARKSQTNNLNTKIFHTYVNPDGQYIKDLLMEELVTLSQELKETNNG